MTDFMNLNIKPSFGCAHKNRVCVRIFIRVNAHTYMNIYICTVFQKKSPTRAAVSPERNSNARFIEVRSDLQLAEITIYAGPCCFFVPHHDTATTDKRVWC
jgi:hypothetical protein